MNVVIIGEGFFISYNPHEAGSPDTQFSELLSKFAALLGKKHRRTQPETALVLEDSTKSTGKLFLILIGDFREEYQKRIHSLDECLLFFTQNIDKMSDWSDKLPEKYYQ